MKFCEYCGTKLFDIDRTCPKCGAPIFEDKADNKTKNNGTSNFSNVNQQNFNNINKEEHERQKKKEQINLLVKEIAFVFMILSCICWGFIIIPLFWMIPMTIHYYNNCIKLKRPTTMFFKVCTLLFCNIISGLIMIFGEQN